MPDDKPSRFGQHLRLLRALHGWRMTDAAKLLGITLRTWHRWEHGHSHPKGAMLERVSAFTVEHGMGAAAGELEFWMTKKPLTELEIRV